MSKIFCDIADINLIKKFNKKDIVKGFTTNPTLMRKAGAKNYLKYSNQILRITKKPVSLEVFADDVKSMNYQGKKISKLGKNVFVKVPVTNSKGKFMGEVIKTLNQNKIKLNITAVYTILSTPAGKESTARIFIACMKPRLRHCIKGISRCIAIVRFRSPSLRTRTSTTAYAPMLCPTKIRRCLAVPPPLCTICSQKAS